MDALDPAAACSDPLVPADSARAAPGTLSEAERALLARLRAGDEETFTSLVARLHPCFVRLAGVFVGDGAAAEEVAQDAWEGILKGLDAFEGRSTVKTWMFRILVNRAKTRAARDRRMVPFTDLALADDPEPAVDPARFAPNGHWSAPPKAWPEETPEALLLRAETRAFVAEEIGRLPEAQRAVVILRDVEGLDAGEACTLLEISESNQRVLLHRGRARLRAALERWLGAESRR